MDHKFASLAQGLAEDEEMSVILFCNLNNKPFHVVTSFAAENVQQYAADQGAPDKAPLDQQLFKICLKETSIIFFMGLPLGSLKVILWFPEHTKAD
jgi:hypothetical protein